MSVVGLTFGKAANAIRPSAANAASVPTSATIRASGRTCSYQAKPAASASARTPNAPTCQLMRCTSAPSPRLDRVRSRRPARVRHRRRRGSSRSRWRSTCPPRGSRPATRPRSPSPPPAAPRAAANAATNSGSWVATSTAASSSRSSAASSSLRPAVHPAGRLVEAHHGRSAGSGASSTIASASRCFSPPDRSRGWREASAASPSPTVASAAGEASCSTRSWIR